MTELITLTIDGQEVSVPRGTLVVDAASKLKIEIPVFCSHPKLDPVACCRMCLVDIEIPGPRSRGAMLMTACSVPVAEGMIVSTDNERVQSTQEANLAFILLNHPLDCPICDKGGECPLQDQTMRYGPGISQLVEPKRRKKKHYNISDTIVLDQERCVVCWRCIRYLEEWEDKPQLGLFERGGETLIDIQPGTPVDAKTGGNIIDICPVGALTNQVSRFNYRPWQIERTPSIDPHFSTGDNIRIDTRSYKIRRIVGRENMQVNDQWIADKSRFAYEWVNSDDRLTMPLVRKGGELLPVTWSEALDAVAAGLKRTQAQHGADAVGMIGSAKLSNESNYLLQRLAREVVGTPNLDHRNGGDIAALPTGMPALADIMKPQYGPDPRIDTVLLVGLDPSEELPILDLHLKRAARRAGVKLMVIHPRQTELTRYGGPYLGCRPGTEVTLLNGLTKAALEASDSQNDEVAALVADVTLEHVAEFCAVSAESVSQVAQALAESDNALILYGPMVAGGESGRAVVDALTNLAMVTGHYDDLGYVGLEANSQGCRDMGLLPAALPGHARLEGDAGKSYKAMLDAAGGAIRALYIMGANPASERPDWRTNLDGLDFLVVQELFLTETAQLADVVLPAVSWAEQDGTFTNVERRVQRAPKAVTNPQSKAAADWMILTHLATRMGAEWAYRDAQSISAEISHVVPIYAGIDWQSIGDQGLQWDATQVRAQPTLRKVEQQPMERSGDYPLALYAGTVAYDGGDLFALTGAMHEMRYPAAVNLNAADAEALGVGDGSAVVVKSRNGSLSLVAAINAQVQPGTAWIPESLQEAPVGALLNGHDIEFVKVEAA